MLKSSNCFTGDRSALFKIFCSSVIKLSTSCLVDLGAFTFLLKTFCGVKVGATAEPGINKLASGSSKYFAVTTGFSSFASIF